MMELTDRIFRPATRADWSNIASLLTEAGLPLAGAQEHLGDFLLACHGEILAGCVALEHYDDTALLRSVAVAQAERGRGLGQELVRRMLAHASILGVRQVVLLTTSAANFFLRFGFYAIPREEVPPAVRESIEFREACPASATVMLRTTSER